MDGSEWGREGGREGESDKINKYIDRSVWSVDWGDRVGPIIIGIVDILVLIVGQAPGSL